MIGKVPDQGKSFRGVVDYLLYGKKDEPDPARVAWTETRNLLVDHPRKAATLMRLTSRKSKRVKKPVYHYVISWRHDQRPDDTMIRQVADTTCTDLGLEEYQRLYVAHRDTEHHHVHIVVNRVHPETGVAWKNSHDYRRIECSLRRQAEAMGMDYVPGRHNDPERFRGRSRQAADKEQQRGRRLGVETLPRWDAATKDSHRTQLQEAFAQAESWQALDEKLSEQGLKVLKKGQGLVIGNDTGAMKLSDLGRDVRLKGLEERFGQSFADHETVHAQRKDDEKSATFEQLADTRATAEMSYYLYRMGIASREEVERKFEEKDRAQAEVERVKPFAAQMFERAQMPKPEPEPEEDEDEPSRPRGRGR